LLGKSGLAAGQIFGQYGRRMRGQRSIRLELTRACRQVEPNGSGHGESAEFRSKIYDRGGHSNDAYRVDLDRYRRSPKGKTHA